MIESHQLAWRTIENGFALHRWQTKTPLLHVVPDTVYPGMWRIRFPDGRLTDMADLTRAKDAAVSIALETLNAGKRGRQSSLEAASVLLNGAPCPDDIKTDGRARQTPSPPDPAAPEPAR